jgi:hypothetical protein
MLLAGVTRRKVCDALSQAAALGYFTDRAFCASPFGRMLCTIHRNRVTFSPIPLCRRSRGDATLTVNMRNVLLAIGAGGLIAGTLDLTQALIFFGKNIPLAIAGGLLGSQAFRGGLGIYILGVLLHFFIACSAAAIYVTVSRKLRFLAVYPLVCGLFFGAAVQLVMSFIVLPLSALHAMGPYSYGALVSGFLVHMILVGVPIAFSTQWFARQRA